MTFGNTPSHCDTQMIAELFEKYVEPMQMKPLFNAETVMSGRTNEIDLTKRPYDIDVRHEPSAPSFERWSAIDLNTYDGGLDAPGNFIGRGSTPHLARMALLDRFAEYDAEGR